jgi:hypothetical protein
MTIFLTACFESLPKLTATKEILEDPIQTITPITPSTSTPILLTTSKPSETTFPPVSMTEKPSQTLEASEQEQIFIVTDEFGAVVSFIPVEWSNYNSSFWEEEDKIIGSKISASTNLAAYMNWGATGVTIYVSSQLDKGYIQMMDEFRDIYAEECEEYKSRWEYENDTHRGIRQRFWRCGGDSGPALDLLALVNKENQHAYIAMVIIVWFKPVEIQLTEDYLLNFLVIPEYLP